MDKNRFTKQEITALVIVALILAGGGLIVGWHFGYEGSNPLGPKNTLSLSDLDYTYNLIHSDYYQATDTQPIIADGISAMVSGLGDHWSFYLPANEYQEIQAQANNQLFDIGVEYVTDNQQALILEVYPGTPASAAGLAPGDIITQINGVDTGSLPGELPITIALLGKAGSSVALTVLQQDGSTQHLTLIRKAYTVPTVSFSMINNQIGYLKIYSFDPTLQSDFIPIEQQIKNSGVQKLIIDLRNNPGGDVDTAIAMLNKFINSGTLFSEYIEQSSQPLVHKAAGNAEFGTMQVAILVNDLTASAAEIFTSSMQENHRATIVGTTTEGKGTEQTWFPLQDGSAVRLTIAKWLTPNGTWINGVGITPDIVASDTLGTSVLPLEDAAKALDQ
jgi:carboxyl-terminal processing protease